MGYRRLQKRQAKQQARDKQPEKAPVDRIVRKQDKYIKKYRRSRWEDKDFMTEA